MEKVHVDGSERLTLRTKVGFGVGDIFGGGAMVVIGFFYLYFLTDVLLISPALAGIVFLVSKAWDAVSDPIMGVITDRTRTRFGRRRPYFLAGVVLVFLAFFFLWFPVGFSKEIFRFIYVMVAYVFYSTVYTLVMVPYSAMASELTLDYDERTSLTTIRIFFSSVSSLVCAVVPFEIVKGVGDERTGFIIMAVVFGLFFGLPYIWTFLATKERPEFQSEPKPFSVKESFVDPFRLPTFIPVVLMYLFAMSAMDIIMSVMVYFMTYFIVRPDETNYVLGVLLIVQILALPVYERISNRHGKRYAYITAAVSWLAFMILSFAITPGAPNWIIYVFAALVGSATGGMVIMIYAILPDIPDVDELYSGQRREGVYSGLATFLRKLSSAFGIFLVSNVIALAGYRKPVEQTVDGVTRLVKQAQTPEFLLVLRFVFAILPVVFLILCLLAASRYRLTRDVHERLKALLKRRRSGEPLETTEPEADAIKLLLRPEKGGVS